jgi:hypothetical protein
MKAIFVITTNAMPMLNNSIHVNVNFHDFPAINHTAIATPIGPVTAKLPATLKACHHIIQTPPFILHCTIIRAHSALSG